MPKSGKTTAKPSVRRTKNQVKTADSPVLESTAHLNGNAEAAASDFDPESSETPVIDHVINQAVHRVRTRSVRDEESPDAYVVDYLPNFQFDHKASPDAARIPCGEVTGLDDLPAEIAARFIPRLRIDEGYFRISPRRSGRFLSGQWVEHVYTETRISESALNVEDDEIEYDDEDIIEEPGSMSPETFGLRLNNARLQERLRYLEGQSRPPQNQSFPQDPIQMMDAMLNLTDKIQQKFAQPKREPQQSQPPVQQPLDPDVAALQMIARDDGFMDRITGGIIGKLIGGSAREEVSPTDVLMEAVKSGEASRIAGAIMGGLQNIVSMIVPPTQQTTQTLAQPRQSVQTEATHQQAGDIQQSGVGESPKFGNTTESPEEAYQRVMRELIEMMASSAPIGNAVRSVEAFLFLNPSFADLLDQQLGSDSAAILNAIATLPGGAEIAGLPHCKTWLENFQERFFADENDHENPPAQAADAKA